MLLVGLAAVGSGCRHVRSSGSLVSDLLGTGAARLSVGSGDTEPLSPSPGSGTSSSTYPLCTHSRISAVQQLSCCSSPASNRMSVALVTWGTSERDMGSSEREGERDVHPPPTHPPMLGSAGTATPPPCTPHPPVHPLPGREEELKFGTGDFGSHVWPRGWERPQGWLQTLPAAPTLRTKVWRLSGISRRVHLRTSCTAEPAMSSFGLEPCEGESRA